MYMWRLTPGRRWSRPERGSRANTERPAREEEVEEEEEAGGTGRTAAVVEVEAAQPAAAAAMGRPGGPSLMAEAVGPRGPSGCRCWLPSARSASPCRHATSACSASPCSHATSARRATTSAWQSLTRSPRGLRRCPGRHLVPEPAATTRRSWEGVLTRKAWGGGADRRSVAECCKGGGGHKERRGLRSRHACSCTMPPPALPLHHALGQ